MTLFDLRVPDSMRDMPGRVYLSEVADKLPKRTHQERLAQMREYSRKKYARSKSEARSVAARRASDQ
jgi:hypothetical protein